MGLNEENKIRKEIIEVKEEINLLRKVRTTVEDYEDLLKDIDSLILKYIEKSNKIEKPTKNNGITSEPIKRIKTEIEYIQNKKKNFSEDYIKYFKNLDSRVGKLEDKENVFLYSKNIPEVSTLFERVNSELQVQQFHFVDQLSSNQIKSEKNQIKRYKAKNYIELFKKVKEKVLNKIEKIRDMDTLEEGESIKKKCYEEFQNFSQNILNQLTISDLDIQHSIHPTLNDLTKTSSNNLLKLGEKIKNLEFQNTVSGNNLGKKLLDMFSSGILLAHQNNYLVSFTLTSLVNPVYMQTLNQALVYANPKDFNEMKKKIEMLKEKYSKTSKKTPRNYVTDEPSVLEELNSDDDENI